MPKSRLTLALLVLLLAAGLRLYHLDTQSLWNDEGNSLRLAQRDPGDLIDAAGRDIHPPGYYLVLKGWIAIMGESEIGLRSLSALEGLLAVACTIALGRTLFSDRSGLIAGVLVALNPFAIYYSQETRMYAQLALLSVLSLWLLVQWLKRPRIGFALALALCNAAGLYTQYSYPFTMIAQGLVVLIWLLIRRRLDRRVILTYAALNLLTLLLFLPWLPTAWDQVTNWPRTGDDLPLLDRTQTILTWITYGHTAVDVNAIWFAFPAMLVGYSLVPDRKKYYGWRITLPLLWAGIVIGALLASGAYREANLKFLLPAQIALALLIGRGAADIRPTTWTGLVLAALMIAGLIQPLHLLYTDPKYARDDYRAMAAQIEADRRPGDAIILDAPNQAEVFSYYYDGDAPVYQLPRGLGGDDVQTRADVLDVIAQHQRIFVLFWGETERDPNRIVQGTLDENAYPVASEWFGDVRLALYTVLSEPPAEPQIQLGAQFGDSITLEGYALSNENPQAGDALGVTLFWTTHAPLDIRYKVTVQLLAPDGYLISQHDSEPGNNRILTTTWAPDSVVIDPHGLIVPSDIAPGDYTLLIGLYDINNPLNRLPVLLNGTENSDHLTLSITIH
jgi:hypothetical protein